jgi:hypothetical protein
MEDELDLSYPTIRNRLHEVIRAWAMSRAAEMSQPGCRMRSASIS